MCIRDRPRGQLIALDQHRVPARLGQMIGDTVADGTTADDEGFDMSLHGSLRMRFCDHMCLIETRAG